MIRVINDSPFFLAELCTIHNLVLRQQLLTCMSHVIKVPVYGVLSSVSIANTLTVKSISDRKMTQNTLVSNHARIFQSSCPFLKDLLISNQGGVIRNTLAMKLLSQAGFSIIKENDSRFIVFFNFFHVSFPERVLLPSQNGISITLSASIC